MKALHINGNDLTLDDLRQVVFVEVAGLGGQLVHVGFGEAEDVDVTLGPQLLGLDRRDQLHRILERLARRGADSLQSRCE